MPLKGILTAILQTCIYHNNYKFNAPFPTDRHTGYTLFTPARPGYILHLQSMLMASILVISDPVISSICS